MFVLKTACVIQQVGNMADPYSLSKLLPTIKVIQETNCVAGLSPIILTCQDTKVTFRDD